MRRGCARAPAIMGSLARRRLLPGAFMAAGDYVGAQRRRSQLIAAVEDALRDVDVLLCASSMDPASQIEDAAETRGPIRGRRGRRSMSPDIRRWR